MASLCKVCCLYHPEAILIEDYHAGDMICPECGLVVGDRVIDVSSEWRTMSTTGELDRNRCGGPENPLLRGSNLSTAIGPLHQSAVLKYHNRQTYNGTDRTLVTAFREISEMAGRINLPRGIVDRAHNLFKQVQDCGRLRVHPIDAKVSACLYIGCRQEGAPRTFKEICAISKVSKKHIGRCFKLILKVLETTVETISSVDFMSRFCANLDVASKIQCSATYIAKKAAEIDIVPGRSPVSVAAAAIYMASQASDAKKTLKEIGDIAGVGEITIRLSYKAMLPHAAKLFPESFIFSTPIEKLPTF